jgi:hypothetical protein
MRGSLLRAFHVAIGFGFGAIAIGCADTAGEQERTARTDDALGVAVVSLPPERQVINPTVPGCGPIPTVDGPWNGAAISGPIGTSPFCTYTWSSPGASTAAAKTKLREAAKNAHVVRDVRVGNPPAAAVTLTGPVGGFTGLAPQVQGGWAAASTFTFGGAPAPSPTLQLTGTTKPQPGGSGCDVCGFFDISLDYLWFVLPPEAMEADGIIVELDEVEYDVGPTTVPVFYSSAPAYSANPIKVRWYWEP